MYVAAVVGDGSPTLGKVVTCDTLEDAIKIAVGMAETLCKPPTDNPTETIEQWRATVQATLEEDSQYTGEKPNGSEFDVAVRLVEES